MILLNDMIYNVQTIQHISINREDKSLTVFFFKDFKILPLTIKFDTEEKLNSKIKEIVGSNEKRKLFG